MHDPGLPGFQAAQEQFSSVRPQFNVATPSPLFFFFSQSTDYFWLRYARLECTLMVTGANSLIRFPLPGVGEYGKGCGPGPGMN